MAREILRTRTSHPHHTSTSIVWGQRHEAQAEAGGSPSDCRVCSCAMATASPRPHTAGPGQLHRANAAHAHRRAPAASARWGFRDETPMGRALPGAFKASDTYKGPVPDARGQVRQGAHHSRIPELLVQEELQRRGGQAQPASPCTYLLSARSVLLPTSMMMTSLPLSVLTSSIHLEVCWKELRSGG